jgi:hypothetical protein
MSWINKKALVSNSSTNRNFSYSKGKVSLAFTLRTDIKDELKIFKELLEVAILEVKEEIEK